MKRVFQNMSSSLKISIIFNTISYLSLHILQKSKIIIINLEMNSFNLKRLLFYLLYKNNKINDYKIFILINNYYIYTIKDIICISINM